MNYQDKFLNEILGMPPQREVDAIELILGVAPIAKALITILRNWTK